MGSSILKMNRIGLLCLFIGLLAITCANAQLGYKPGGGGSGGGGNCKDKYDEDGGYGGKCKDKMDKKKCKKIMEAGKCEDEKMAKKCMKTCDMCEDMGPKKTPFELIDENGDGNITR